MWFRLLPKLCILALLTAGPVCAKPFAVDGDTLHAKHARIRLANVCAPERGEPGYAEAKAKLTAIINAASSIYFDCSRQDRYGRLVCRMYVDSRLVTQSDISKVGGRGTSFCARAR